MVPSKLCIFNPSLHGVGSKMPHYDRCSWKKPNSFYCCWRCWSVVYTSLWIQQWLEHRWTRCGFAHEKRQQEPAAEATTFCIDVFMLGWVEDWQEAQPLAWNLLVDLLGKEKLFDVMWDRIKIMRTVGIVPMETISAMFGNYVHPGKIEETGVVVLEENPNPADMRW